MQITITQDDWMKLSLTTRRELKRFITEQFQAKEDEGLDTEGEQDQTMYDLNDQMMKRFMAGVSKTTAAFLKCFVKDGKGRIDELLEATGYSRSQDFRGVSSGITRRIRKLFNDPDALIVNWQDDEDDEEWGGHYYVKEGTRQTLENYFSD